MYSDYAPTIVFGWNEGNNDDVINFDCLITIYKLDLFSSEVAKQICIEPYYGLPCAFYPDGTIRISDEDKETVINAYNSWYNYHKNNNDERIKYVQLGFHTVLSGDIIYNQIEYMPESSS